MDFETLSYENALELIPERDAEWLNVNQKYADGDHWQDGDGWSGPVLEEGHPAYDTALDYVARIFAPEDIVNEMMERHVQGVIGREPVWYLADNADDGVEPVDQALVDEVTPLLQSWLEEKQVFRALQDAVAMTLWGKRATLRLFVPSARLQNGEVPRGTLPEVLDHLFLEVLDPTQASVIADPASREPLGIYAFQDGEIERVELTYTDENGLTVIRTTGEGGQETRLELGRRLTMYELKRPLLLTPAMIRNQKKVNHASTAEQANLATAGFIARIFFNAKLPGKEEIDPITKQAIFTPDPLQLGPSTANFLVGVTTTDMDGKSRTATPSYVREEPASPETFIKTKLETRRHMLFRAQQGHVLLTSDAQASGESRLRARGDFEASLSPSKSQVDKALTWLLETVLAMAGLFSGGAGRYAGLRIVADAQLDLGVITPAEQEAAIRLQEVGLISQQTAMSRVGVDDIAGELELLTKEMETNGETNHSDPNNGATDG